VQEEKSDVANTSTDIKLDVENSENISESANSN
jgi:hypothetical protein